MKTLFISFLFCSTLILSGCDEEPLHMTCDQSQLATVRDLTGLDGCGYVFELADGTRLEPMRLFYCGTPPLSKEMTEDPLYDFEFLDGKKVKIAYEEIPDAASICMVGKIVKITCLEEISVVHE
ncbi:MAG: hypothetical protein JNL53_11325 [Cyclobacteriaceae bacterium]|nr:hypothetical protein [Cyclobacteriaceae bacterium]